MPDFLNPAQVELRDQAERLAQQLMSQLAPQLADSTDYVEVVAESKAAGIWHLTQPPANPTALDLVIVRDALGRYNVAHLPGIFAPAATLLQGVQEPLRSTVLPKFLAGELRASFGFTEPIDAARPTWAVLEGDELVVNGQKSYVSGGGDADFISTLVEVDDHGPAMVFIETTRPGVQLVRRFGTLDGSHHAAFTFTDVRVPVSHLLSQPGKGMGRALDQISGVRMALAAQSIGLCDFVIGEVEQHLVGRAESQSTKSQSAGSEQQRTKLGEMRANAYAARATVYRTARIVDAGENSVNEVIAAKVIATETVGRLVDSAVQIVGGQALADQHPLNAILRRVRSFRLAEGPTDTLYSNIARGSLDLGHKRI